MPKSNINSLSLATVKSKVRIISCLLLWLTSSETAFAQAVERQNTAPEFIKTSFTERTLEAQEAMYYDDTRTHIIVCSLIIAAYGVYWRRKSKI